jgi:phosphatidyl-myo-inositol dimannoside synthase
MAHLLVTNDFPPKIGGIQSYLWELWRRLPEGEAIVLTTPHADSDAFDAAAPMRIIRTRQRWLLPTPVLYAEIERIAKEHDIWHIVLDPALPVGLLGPALAARGYRYSLVVHGAEVTVPGRFPVLRQLLARTLKGATHIVAAGGYPLAEAQRAAKASLPATVIPPGVDVERFSPARDCEDRRSIRTRLNLPPSAPIVIGSSRLVPRKGFDVVIDAVARLSDTTPGIVFALSGRGRDAKRLASRAKAAKRKHPHADVRLLGRLSDTDLVDLLRCGDVYAMLCRNRWGGLEQEGFGIVFLEAAACGLPQVAGASGGSHEAVVDGITGVVVAQPKDVTSVAAAIGELIDDPDRRARMGEESRRRAQADLTYDVLAERLLRVLESVGEGPGAPSAVGPRVRSTRR